MSLDINCTLEKKAAQGKEEVRELSPKISRKLSADAAMLLAVISGSLRKTK